MRGLIIYWEVLYMDLYYISWPHEWLKYFGYEQVVEYRDETCSISLRRIKE